MKVSTQSLQTSIEPFVGGRVRPAVESDSIVGVRPQIVVEPDGEEEIAAVLAFANKEGLKVGVRGAGTQLGIGFPPTGNDILLSTTRLHQVIEHAPHDLTVSVQAGIPIDKLQATLAQAGQWLALDPDVPPEATIGGIIATNASGPRRLRYGGVRDQIIGIRVVLPNGTIAKGGGKVVKNVAGYDLPKLFTGSLGTLGVIASATFRLYPKAAASRTVVLTAPDVAPLGNLAVRIIGSILVPTMIDVLGSSSEENMYRMVVRFEMGEQAAEDQATALIEMATGDSAIQSPQMLHGEEEAAFLSRLSLSKTSSSEHMLTIKASLLPTDVAPWLMKLQNVLQQEKLHASWRAHAGHGLIFVQLSGDNAALMRAVDALRQQATHHQGNLVVLDGPLSLLQYLDVWGSGSAQEVMRRLKATFDPNATLNPGRFVGRI